MFRDFIPTLSWMIVCKPVIHLPIKTSKWVWIHFKTITKHAIGIILFTKLNLNTRKQLVLCKLLFLCIDYETTYTVYLIFINNFVNITYYKYK